MYIREFQQQHEPLTYVQHLASKPHCVVLQERVPVSDPVHLKMYLKLGMPDKPGSRDSSAISCAGKGPLLQVAGSVPEVANPGALGRSRRTLFIPVPKVLLCPQLPADTTCPLVISLRVLPPPGVQQGQWAARIFEAGNSGWRVYLGAAHPLSAYVGRSISKMSLSQDRQLTLTFAAAPAAPAPAATLASMHNTPPEPPEQPQSRKSLKRRAPAGSTGQQQPGTDGQLPGSNFMAAAAAAAGGALAQAAAQHNKLKKTQRQLQQAAAAAAAVAAGAVLPPKRSAGQAARAQQAADRAAKGAAADSAALSAAAACKRRRQAQQQQQQQEPPAAAGTATEEEPPAAPVHIKQEADSSTPPAAAAANTGLLFWHMGELSSSSSGDEDEDDSLGGDAEPAAAGPAAGPLLGAPSAAFGSAAAVDASPAAPTAPAASTQHDRVDTDMAPAATATATATAAAAAGACSQQAVWFAGEQHQPGRGREHDSTGGAGEPATPAAQTAAPTAEPAVVAPAAAPTPAGSLPDDRVGADTAAATTAAAPVGLLVPGTAAADVSLPPGLTLPAAASPAEMECELVGVMTGALLPLLPRQTYVDRMRQLRELFARMESGGAVAAEQLRRLRCKYAYVQAAVYGGQLAEVVAALRGLA